MKRLFIFTLLIAACSKTEKPAVPETPVAPPLSPGLLYEHLTVVSDTTRAYAAFVPPSYRSDKPAPLAVCFDAHGRADLPVTKYRELASRFGFVLVASYAVRNGLAWETIVEDTRSVMKDIRERLAIDSRRIYTIGFSGGSRIAGAMALSDPTIAGVIGCAAGYPAIQQRPGAAFNFIGLVGLEDCNLVEMQQWDALLESAGSRHQLITFNGGHEWPDSSAMEWAFLWFQLQAMRDHTAYRDESLVQSVAARHEKLVEELRYQGKPYERYLLYRRWVLFLEGLDDVTEEREAISQLEKTYSVKMAIPQEVQNQRRELQKQQEYVQALSERKADWWRTEVRRLNEPIRKDKTTETALLNKRLLNFISLAIYGQVTAAWNAGDIPNTKRLLGIYDLVDPANPEPAYVWACIFAAERRFDLVVPKLKEAIARGFKDRKRIEQESVLGPLRVMPEYSELAAAMPIEPKRP